MDRTDIWTLSEIWLDSAAFLAIGLKMSRSQRDVWSAHHYLIVMARLQYAVELSYQRFDDACRTREDITQAARGYLECHAFLVSAHAYWRIFEKLSNVFVLQESLEAIEKYRVVIEETKIARDHLEHIDERIETGRSNSYGSPMSARTFRQSLGRYDAGKIKFGDEEFNLASIHDAVITVGQEIAPKILALIQSGFEVKKA